MPPQRPSVQRIGSNSRFQPSPKEAAREGAHIGGSTAPAFRMSMVGRERIESTLDKWHDDDLSIVASEEDDGSSADGQSIAAPGAADGKATRTEPEDLVKNETRAVGLLKNAIVALLFIGGVLLSIGTFMWVEDAEKANNDSSGSSANCAWGSDAVQEAYAEAMETAMEHHQAALLVGAFTLSVSFTSFAMETLSGSAITWPMVSIPDFDTRVTAIIDTTGATEVRMAPLVDSSLRSSFEDYAVEAQRESCSSCSVVANIYNADESAISSSADTLPVWEAAPFAAKSNIMQNLFAEEEEGEAARRMQDLGAGVISDFIGDLIGEAPKVALHYPVFADFQQADLAGSLSFLMDWSRMLEITVPFELTDVEANMLLLQSCSGQVASFEISQTGKNLTYSGPLRQIPAAAQQDAVSFVIPGAYYFGNFQSPVDTTDACPHTVWIVPVSSLDGTFVATGSSGSSDDNDSNKHIVVTVVVALFFVGVLALFAKYDKLVERRQAIVINIATKSSAIVENLFPAQVRERMLENLQKDAVAGADGKGSNGDAGLGGAADLSPNEVVAPTAAPNQVSVKQFLSDEPGANNDLSTAPIADLFPNTTVLFADIAGFTAWSSQREPPQVFTLLETLYRSFDVIARKLKVFKVETIGDCYMAVTGLPHPDEVHAVHMSRFAYQCLIGMKELIKELEAILGPGTSDLALRVGLHSGPVTAGVLRGEKSRFQLFGDTVNTASRMESTGARGKIQVSQETADLLMGAGKSHWLKPREERVMAKGKGELKTYWLDPTKKRRHTKGNKDIRVAQEIALNANGDPDAGAPGAGEVAFDDKYARLIDWNVDVLLHHLARVISSRSRSPSRGSLVNHSSEVALLPAAINDVADVVALPPFDPDASKYRRARPDVSMLQQTRADLHEYVKRIALMYRDVPFHNFEHASHVTLCANKLMNRLINSDEYETEEELHNSTYGISSDPLTHFAIVFAALIHDVDHTGLPNAQLVKDRHEVALKFDNKSVAEQNSVHIGWEMLMDPRFERLRKCIYQTNVERKRFRQLVINSVMATDIADRNVNEERQKKWDRAFKHVEVEQTTLQSQEEMNRKGTAVIEHIIQVSDVAHTMQHWHIYRRWNERLFHEMHEAFANGPVTVDPSTNWHIGEIGFFDYFLIPLAMKLKECGVFGASGYEYISYVLKNKKEWERKGRQVVQEMVLLYKDVDDDEGSNSSFMSDEEYDSDDLEYDSPGDMSSDEEDDTDPYPKNPAQAASMGM